jgi:cytochrome c peroxidase
MKNRSILLLFGLIVFASLALTNCQKEKISGPYKYESDLLNLPETPFNYQNPNLPAHLFDLKNRVQSSVTDHGATLGRVLFYDPKLSLTNNIACASCHKQENGFADPVKFSTGFDGGLTKRNANSIANLATANEFFWDARENNLVSMVLKPIENHIEMGMDQFDVLTKKLSQLGYYDALFANAFGDKTITSQRIASALAQFLSSMASGNSKFDRGEPTSGGWGSVGTLGRPEALNSLETAGMGIFLGKAGCISCHDLNSASFGSNWADIGLESNYTLDKGIGENNQNFVGMFKVPNLRNVGVSGPYMHDGRFATLREVIDHYNENIQNSPNLDWRLDEGDQPRKLNLTSSEKDALEAFLHALTDDGYMHDARFSNPFK